MSVVRRTPARREPGGLVIGDNAGVIHGMREAAAKSGLRDEDADG